MVNKYAVDPELAGSIPSLLPLGTLFLTPFFGNLYDRKGKGATIMVIGACMLIGVHLLFALPLLNEWWFATIIMIILGIAFSLVPSAMWPSVPKIIPEKNLGTAYSLIYWIQNMGMLVVPIFVGKIIEKTPDEIVAAVRAEYLFIGLAVVAVIVSFILSRSSDNNPHLRLDVPNKEKKVKK